MRPVIVILGSSADEHALHVLQGLRAAGEDAVLFDTAAHPAAVCLTFQPDGRGMLSAHGRPPVPWADIRSVYWRNYGGPGLVGLPNEEQAQLARNDARSLLETFLQCCPARWVNSWAAYRWHQMKPAAFARANALDLPAEVRLPDTVWSNELEHLRAFAAEHPRCIFKPVQGGAHSLRLEARHLEEAARERLTRAPVTLQEEIVGRDIRVFIAGEALLACEIRTEALDFRDDPGAAICACELPETVQAACRDIAQALDLKWTGIDLRRTAEGIYYYFEANPSPMFLGFQSRSGLDLSGALLQLLRME